MRRTFLEQNNPILFNDMVLTETLFSHLWEVQQTCEKRMDLLMKELLEKNRTRQSNTAACMGGIHEQPKSTGRGISALRADLQLKQMIYNEGWPAWSAFSLWIHSS